MNAKKGLVLLLPAALALASPPAEALSVTSVGLAVSPAASEGPCPVELTFTGKVVLNGRGNFTYKWERGDGAIDSTAPHTGVYDGVNPAVVTTTWTLGAATSMFHPYDPARSTETIHILSPTDVSKTAQFRLDCGAGNPMGRPVAALAAREPATNCNGQPDLVPLLHSPMDAVVGVKNIGTGNAGPSVLYVTCNGYGVTSHKGGGNGCFFVSPELMTPPFFVGPGNGTVGLHVPALACGKEFVATMPWWASLYSGKGHWIFTATADATNVVAESNESNNDTTSALINP